VARVEIVNLEHQLDALRRTASRIVDFGSCASTDVNLAEDQCKVGILRLALISDQVEAQDALVELSG
jgi:hypothetical protein